MMSLFEIMACFLYYSFMGWCLEVVYHGVSHGSIVNRGFLNGPLCPIYGFGMVSVLLLLEPFSDQLLLLYLGGMTFATAIELFGGWALYRLFSMRWWDYSKEPLNLGGYICLKFSLAWGFCIVFVIRCVHPVTRLQIAFFNRPLGHILLTILYAALAADLINTVMTVLHLNRDLKRVNKIASDLRRFSDNLTDQLGSQSIDAAIRVQESRVQSTLARYEMEEELGALRKKMLSHTHVGYGRLFRAFPDLRHKEYAIELQESIESLRMKLEEHRKDQKESQTR